MVIIPSLETHRGVEIHDFQSAERIETVVKPAIDRVYEISTPGELFAYAANSAHPPEARLFATDKYHAGYELKSEAHTRRSGDLELIDAHVAGLDSLGWASPTHYGTLLEPPPAPPGRSGAALRPPEQAARLEAAQQASTRTKG